VEKMGQLKQNKCFCACMHSCMIGNSNRSSIVAVVIVVVVKDKAFADC